MMSILEIGLFYHCVHILVIRLKINPTTSANAINLLVPFLRLYSQQEFKNYLIILSTLRSRWIYTA